MKTHTWIQISRFFLCFLLTSFFILHITHWANFPLLDRLDNITYDLRLKATTSNTLDPRIVIIDIDEKSLGIEGRWPWSRNKLSELVDILFEHYQIKLLGFDITFPEHDNSSGLPLFEQLAAHELKDNSLYLSTLASIRPQLKYDDLFSKSLENRNIVLGYVTAYSEHLPAKDTSLPSSIANINQYNFTNTLFHATSYSANLTSFQQAAQRGGFFNNPFVDIDGSFRRIPMLAVYNKQIYEALSLAIFRALLAPEPIAFNTASNYDNNGSSRLESIDIGSFSIPVNEKSILLIPYRGRQGSFKYISATDVLSFSANEITLKDKIVIFGSSAAGILDLRTTPIQNIFPGVEIQANILSGMLDQRIKYRPSFIAGIEFVFIVFLSLIGTLFFPRLSAGKLSLLFIFLLLVTTSLNFYFWQYHHIDSVLATPVLFLSLLFTIQIIYNYFLESRNKKYITSLFGQYIPAELVTAMAQSKQDFSMHAESRELTVLFSDVRDFTSISEKFEADELAELINEILSPITKIIHENNGTIDKYMGDAVMAFWGAPIHNTDHANDALKTALEITPIINKISKEFVAKGWPPIGLGVGLNTGSMCVGNMGSEFRVAYTVLGDAVNLGSRLEGLTKQYGVKVIVSESTKDAAPGFIYKELDTVRVKGKVEPIRIFEPLGLKSEITSSALDQLNLHSKGLSLYLQQDWEVAQQIFTQLQLQSPEQLINQIYLERIRDFIQNPPSSSWDGTYTHTSK